MSNASILKCISWLTRAGIVLIIGLPAMLHAAAPMPATKLQVLALDPADKPLAGVDVYLIRENDWDSDRYLPRLMAELSTLPPVTAHPIATRGP